MNAPRKKSSRIGEFISTSRAMRKNLGFVSLIVAKETA